MSIPVHESPLGPVPPPLPPHHAPGTLLQACARLDGADRLSLQRLAYRLRQQARTADDVLRLRAMGHALVDLRRTGGNRYDAFGHVRRARARNTFVDPDLVTRVLASCLTVGEEIRIIGEPHSGEVIHRIVDVDTSDAFPAPWYVVAVDALHQCRAHGTDELEPAAGAAPAVLRGKASA